MAWIESHQSLGRHLKLRRLARLLRVHPAQAIGHLHYLWWWALDGAPSGDLSGLTNLEIAELADWPGDPDAFVSALTSCGWLDQDGRIHDWQDYAGRIVEERHRNRERMRRARAARSTEACAARAAHVPHTCGDRAGATVPNPTKETLSLATEPVWPSLEECLRVADTRAVPRDCIQKWWHEHDARGGRDRHGQPLARWESNLLAYAAAWMANEARRAPKTTPPRPNRNAGTYNEAVVGQYARSPHVIRA